MDLPRSARLRRPDEFAAALAAGPIGARRHFSVFARPNGLAHARLGIVTSKKVAPRAVDRNRVKRIVREAFRIWRGRLLGLDVLVRMRRCPSRGEEGQAGRELTHFLTELAGRTGANGP
jgi:ribonuclease P protein component